MLSRIAESLFWIGRYVERSDGTARILDVHLQLILADHVAVTPAGSPVGVPIPVAPVILYVTVGNNELIQLVGEGLATDPVLFGVTMIVPVAVNTPQPPANGIV